MPGAGFDYFGWEGISFLKPADWDLSHVEGKADKGSAVLDDGVKCRVQLRWQKSGKEADIGKAAARQEKALLKKDRNAELKVADYRVKTFSGKVFRLEDAAGETFYYMLQCRDCLQVVLLGVFGDRGGGTEEVCGKILRSLRDHAKDGKILWSVYGFAFNAPVELGLKEHKLRSGDLSFEFGGERGSVFFHRLSLAGILLKNRSLNGWLVEFVERKYENVRLSSVFEDSSLRPGGVSARGREMSRFNLLKKRFFNGYFWVEKEKNSIVGVVELCPGSGSDAGELAAGVLNN